MTSSATVAVTTTINIISLNHLFMPYRETPHTSHDRLSSSLLLLHFGHIIAKIINQQVSKDALLLKRSVRSTRTHEHIFPIHTPFYVVRSHRKIGVNGIILTSEL